MWLLREFYGHLIIFALFALVTAESYYVQIRGDGSAVAGATLNFSAILSEHRVPKEGEYAFNWYDNAKPSHRAKYFQTSPYSNWSVTYPRNLTEEGPYRVTVEVQAKFLFIWTQIAINHVDFYISESLGGGMRLWQKGVKRTLQYVSTDTPVNHTVDLRYYDRLYLEKNATAVQTYWFQNCSYLGITDGLSYEQLYPDAEKVLDIEALVMASFEKLPEPTTTTTTTTTTTPATTTSTSSSTSTTPKPPANSTTTTTTTKKPSRQRRYAPQGNSNSNNNDYDAEAEEAMRNAAYANAALLGMNLSDYLAAQQRDYELRMLIQQHHTDPEFKRKMPFKIASPYDCINSSIVVRDQKKVYGYFSRRIMAKDPVTEFAVDGKNWLQYGDILDLNIKCKGSPSLKLCTLVFNAPYNATGNETCNSYQPLLTCDFPYKRFFIESKTILFFIRNDVSQIMNQVTINIYEAKKQSQLSVVVVPVVFTLIAVILVIFGVSYYLQSQNRFTVEVADFNFGETQSLDMEYKTFQQRLFESIRDALPNLWHGSNAQTNGDFDTEPVSPSGGAGIVVDSNIRYDNMN